MKRSIIILGGKGESTTILYNKLTKTFNVEKVILEESPSKKKVIKYRIKKLGLIKVIGQLLFSVFGVKLIEVFSKTRREEIIKKAEFELKDIPSDKILSVNSVNSNLAREIINSSSSDTIIVSGTRIIGNKTLSSTDKKFINIHAGITPKYRGVHGGYWAMANNDKELCGVTVHYVDKGVDTGQIIAQDIITPTKKDTFYTYPLLQLKKGIDMLEYFLLGVNNEEKLNNFEVKESKQYFHPTLWGYVIRLVIKKVK